MGTPIFSIGASGHGIRGIGAFRPDLRALAALLVIVGAAMTATGVALFPAWSAGALLASLLVAAALPPLVKQGVEARLAVFFGLFATADFVKRSTFVFPGQALWSQYLVLIVPTVVYAVAILVPWLGSGHARRWCGVQTLCAAYVVVALANTWLSPEFSLQVKAAATTLLILPWSMLLVAADRPSAVSPVSRVLTLWGVISVLYALVQFALGPTVVELRWAESAGQLSIGASHLAIVLYDDPRSLGVWRVNGLQPDEFTFGMFCLTALTAVRLLYASGQIGRPRYVVVSLLLGLGIALSLVRTIWVATLAALAGSWAARRFPALLRSWLALPGLAAAFVLGDLLAEYLYNLAGLAAGLDNPLLARAVTLGTLEARKGAMDAFLEAASAHWLLGLGHGASGWVSDKFGEGGTLPDNFAAHNAIVEQVWYAGLPGLALFLGVLIGIFHCAGRALQSDDHRRRELAAVLAGCLLGMVISGLGNGGGFLEYPFFFFAGALTGEARASEGEQWSVADLASDSRAPIHGRS